MGLSEDVRAAAEMGVRADSAEEGFALIRTRTGTTASDAELAEVVAKGVLEGRFRDPVRLELGHLQCYWKLELASCGCGDAGP
jgi:hypothetical protein